MVFNAVFVVFAFPPPKRCQQLRRTMGDNSRQQQLRFLTFAVVEQLEPGSHEYPINYVGHTLHTFAFHGR